MRSEWMVHMAGRRIRHEDRRDDAYVALVARTSRAKCLARGEAELAGRERAAYSARDERTGIAWVRLADVLPHFPFLVRDNLAEERDIVLTGAAAADVVATYGTLFPLERDQPPPPALADIVARIPRGTPYVLTILGSPSGDSMRDRAGLKSGLTALTGGRVPSRSEAPYEVWAGLTGEAPVLYRSSARPFHARVNVGGEQFTIRMDSWLPDDTFRRGGFGHVLQGRTHALLVERGVSFVWLERDGSPAHFYGESVYTPEGRFRIRAPRSTWREA